MARGGVSWVRICEIDQSDRRAVDEFIAERWFTLQMVVHGESIDLAGAEGVYALEGGEIVGLVTYRVRGEEMELLSLDSSLDGRGVGTTLLCEAARVAEAKGCVRLAVATTNDNVAALGFYQKRGFDIVRIRRDAVDAARRIKPEIPLVAENGIPVRHEIDLEMPLERSGV